MSQEIVPVDVQAWLVLSFGEQRQHGGNVGYRDDPERVYRYDSFVPNHRRVSPGHLLVIAGRDGLVGFARIERIERQRGTKTFLRCPACRTSGIKKRSSAKLLFRCNHGHEFDVPITDQVECMEYEAHYSGSFARAASDIAMEDLRKACPKYADQLAIQHLDFKQIQARAYRSAPELEAVLDVPLTLAARSKEVQQLSLARREHVVAALRRIDEGGVVPSRHRAKLYEVVQDGNRYPAKYVLSLAMENLAGSDSSPVPSETLACGVLRRLGFTVERIGGTAELIEELMDSKAEDAPDWEFDPTGLQDARERLAGEILKRRGQPSFRKKLLRIYENRCAITGCNAIEVLEACHIVPYLGPKTNHPSNGLILRADVHTLFDLDLITIEPESMRVVVSQSLRGSEYGSLEGIELRKPASAVFAPSPAAFEERRKRAGRS